MVSWCKKGECNAQISPKSELCGFKWANTHNKTVHDSMGLVTSSPTHVLCGRTTFVPNQIRYQINTVPTPTVAWTRAWLLQEGGGGLRSAPGALTYSLRCGKCCGITLLWCTRRTNVLSQVPRILWHHTFVGLTPTLKQMLLSNYEMASVLCDYLLAACT